MSRIGNMSVAIPEKVEVNVGDGIVSVKGRKGELSMNFDSKIISISVDGDSVKVSRKNDSKIARSRHGLHRAILQNLIIGVTDGFSKSLEIKGVGYRAALKGQIFEMNLGFSHPILYKIPTGIEIKFDEKNQNIFTVSGIDKQRVGQVSAEIRSFRPPEPYKGKGIRYSDERVARKAGKAAASK